MIDIPYIEPQDRGEGKRIKKVAKKAKNKDSSQDMVVSKAPQCELCGRYYLPGRSCNCTKKARTGGNRNRAKRKKCAL